MSNITKTTEYNRSHQRKSITVYLNCGDPDIRFTYDLILQCHKKGVDIIELGVPFDHSFTDGPTVLKSHKRALQNNVQLEDVLELVKTVKRDCPIPIVLLIDFSHSIKTRGIAEVVKQSSLHLVDGLLFHGLPPLYTQPYVEQTNNYDVERIFSLYPQTNDAKMQETLRLAQGFIYMVSQYGKTGSPVDFKSPTIAHFYNRVRSATALPLFAGFGVNGPNEMAAVFSHQAIDGVIIGSAVSKLVESNLADLDAAKEAIDAYFDAIVAARDQVNFQMAAG